MLFSSEVVALGLYNLTVTRVWLRSWLSRIPLLTAAILAVIVLMKSRLQQISLLDAAVSTFDQTFLHFFPVTGWITGWTMGIIQGNWQPALLDLLLLLVTLCSLIAVVWRSDADYYEDVLVATENKFNTIQAAKEGRRVLSDQPERKRFINRKASLAAGWGCFGLFLSPMAGLSPAKPVWFHYRQPGRLCCSRFWSLVFHAESAGQLSSVDSSRRLVYSVPGFAFQ